MDLSVVVPTYNQAAVLSDCLSALAEQSLRAEQYEVIVVDDASTDGTPAAVQRFAGGPMDLRLTRLETNRGRSAARNAGIRASRGEIVVFLDSDVVVGPEFLKIHLAAHRRHGPSTLTRGPVVSVPSAALASRRRPPRVAASPAYLDTANAAVPKANLMAAGLFDEGFPGYGWEDVDLGQRLKRLGVRRVFCREAVGWHVQPPPDPDDVPGLLEKEHARARSAAYLLRKNASLEVRWLVQWTAFHRALYWLAAGGGRLRADRAVRMAMGMRRAGLDAAAMLIVRAALNHEYLEHLRRDLRGDVVLA